VIARQTATQYSAPCSSDTDHPQPLSLLARTTVVDGRPICWSSVRPFEVRQDALIAFAQSGRLVTRMGRTRSDV
jgi:hypothetical protein